MKMASQGAHKKLKVLHVHDVAFVGSTLVSGLRSIGVDAELYTFLSIKNSKLPKILRAFSTAVLRFLEVFRLGRYIGNKSFDIIHVHYGSFAYLALLNRIPFYLHIHGTDVRKFIHWPVLGNIIRKGLEKAITVFYTTPDLKELVEPYRKDAVFFPNPIDTDKFRPPVDQKPTQTPVIFNINKIDRFKGLDRVLSGLELLWEQMPEVQVMMFGFGNALEEAQDFLTRHAEDPRLTLLSRVLHEEMVKLIQNSTLVLGQMSTGAMGCSELEAMACAKPVVCNFSYESMYPSPPPVFKAETAEEARDQMIWILKHPELAQEKSAEAREWIVNNFNKKLVAQKLVQIYCGKES